MSGDRALNAYIDESGDEGFTRLGWRKEGVQQASTEWLLLGAVVVPAEVDAERMRVVDELRRQLGKKGPKPLHWRDLRHDHEKKRIAMDLLGQQGFRCCIVALYKPPLKARARGLQKRGYLYNYATRFLVERLTWMAEDHDRAVNLYFEHRATTSYTDLQHYLQRIANDQGATIKRGRICEVRPVEATRKGAQVADFYVSAAAEALEPTLSGYTEEDYLLRVSHQLYRHPQRSLIGYGFKVFPPESLNEERYPWAREFIAASGTSAPPG